MRTEQARPVRLQDYRPPDWLVETVHLDVSLHPTATRVRADAEPQAQSGHRPGPAGARWRRPHPVSVAVDGQPLAATHMSRAPDSFTHGAAAAAALHAGRSKPWSTRPPTRS